MREYKLVVVVGAIAIVGFAACCYSPAVAQPPAGMFYQANPEPPPVPPGEQPPPVVQPVPVRPGGPVVTTPPRTLEEITTQPGVSRASAVKQDDEKVNFNPPAMLGEPPKIELSKDELNNVKARIEYWKNIFVQSGSENEVLKAKDRLIEDYLFFFSRDEAKANQSPDYQIAWARLAAAAFGPLFGEGMKKDDNLKRLKEINLSMVFLVASQIYPIPAEGKEYRGNIDIVSVVERMVEHENPAVRYFGWRAYRNLRIQLLASTIRGGGAVANMRALINKGQNETSAPVLGCYFGMLDFPATDPLYGVKDSVLTGFRKDCYGIVKSLWGKWLPRIWQGDIDVAIALGKGLECMKGLAPMASKEPNGKKVLLQNIMDLLYCSANSFDRQWNHVPVTTDSGQQHASWFKYLKSEFEAKRQPPPGATGVDNPVIQASVIITLECEKALNAILGLKEEEDPRQKAYIKDAWKAGDVIMVGPEGQPKKPVLNDRSEKIFDAVKKWADDLKDLCVEFPPKIAEPPVLPQDDSPTPATQPAVVAPPPPLPKK